MNKQYTIARDDKRILYNTGYVDISSDGNIPSVIFVSNIITTVYSLNDNVK
jgi:hypothetical protein